MAAYFHGSHEIQPETMQTLYLMTPNFAGYSDAPPPANMLFMNSPPLTLPQPQHLVGIPVHDSSRPSSIHWTPSQRGLSLSLPVPEIASHAMVHDEEVKALGSQCTALVNSKYLRFAQQLLDEVVSVWKGIRDGSAKGHVKSNGDGDHGERQDESAKRAVELTTVERQELQMKKAKLVNMLDEVGQRYRQYHHQMQIIVSSFEAAAGIGSAKAYTALALQTISKQFRCLQDAITGQIRATAKSLGEEEFVGEGTKSKGSRLQFVDQQVRQQRALQQLGMIHQSAWRPQRGLPERSVSVLRAWLFEHFLHPYPKDSDKQMLAKQTGLTRSQVSNWFINARVRLWKPMVEEMYKEEMKAQEQVNADEKTSENNVKEDSSSKSNACQESSPTRTGQACPQPPTVSVPPSFTNVYSHASYGEGDDNMFMQSNLKKSRSEESMNRRSEHNNYSFITGLTSHGGGFGEYSVGEIERFGIEQFTPRLSSNSVSLTLGLTQYGNISLSGAQPSYISGNGIESNGFPGLDNNQSAAHPSNAYENMSIESRKRFAAQLLSDFVA